MSRMVGTTYSQPVPPPLLKHDVTWQWKIRLCHKVILQISHCQLWSILGKLLLSRYQAISINKHQTNNLNLFRMIRVAFSPRAKGIPTSNGVLQEALVLRFRSSLRHLCLLQLQLRVLQDALKQPNDLSEVWVFSGFHGGFWFFSPQIGVPLNHPSHGWPWMTMVYGDFWINHFKKPLKWRLQTFFHLNF